MKVCSHHVQDAQGAMLAGKEKTAASQAAKQWLKEPIHAM